MRLFRLKENIFLENDLYLEDFFYLLFLWKTISFPRSSFILKMSQKYLLLFGLPLKLLIFLLFLNNFTTETFINKNKEHIFCCLGYFGSLKLIGKQLKKNKWESDWVKQKMLFREKKKIMI